jgi:hypothetical protein
MRRIVPIKIYFRITQISHRRLNRFRYTWKWCFDESGDATLTGGQHEIGTDWRAATRSGSIAKAAGKSSHGENQMRLKLERGDAHCRPNFDRYGVFDKVIGK